MKDKERNEKIKSLLNEEFLEKLKEVAKLYGWSGDYVEISQFVQDLYVERGLEISDKELEPYEIEFD